MWALLAPVVTWLIRAVVVKFIVLAAVFAVLAVVIPVAIGLIAPHISSTSLTSSFSSIDPGVWWFLDMFALDYGLPLLLSAVIARFLLRRLPYIN